MIIYPAIDILDKKCVRLSQGDYSKVTVYSDNPSEFAAIWASKGAEFLHVVDLNGARTGNHTNDEVLSDIVENAGIPIQVGGGVRSAKRIETLLELGIERVILGTSAVKDSKFVKKVLKEYGGKIVIGIDARDGYVAIDGWEKKTNRKAVEFAKEMESLGAETIIYTDISRDGMLTGPNLKAMETMVVAVKSSIIASGGVGCIDDIVALNETGVVGVITGKALYEKRFDLPEARKTLRRKPNVC